MAAIQTLGELRRAGYVSRPVKQEIRDNLVRKLQAGEKLFPGILGLRGQAKSRILRGLVDLLDDQVPVMPGCEIHDDPLAPICAACRARCAQERDALVIGWLPREARLVPQTHT